MTLFTKQVVFAQLVSDLIQHAFALGFEVTLGETWRSPEEAARLAKAGKGIVKSLHTQRLAIDLNLFEDGDYLTQTEDYRALGEWWEQQSTETYQCAWGGRFSRPDGCHFSIAHGGRR